MLVIYCIMHLDKQSSELELSFISSCLTMYYFMFTDCTEFSREHRQVS